MGIQTEAKRARKLIDQAESLAVVGHERPDGDAIGSMLALSLALRELGKPVDPVLVGGIPKRFRFLPGAASVLRSIPDRNQLLIAVDTGDVSRLGFSDVGPIAINFDHHPTNTHYAEVNLVMPEAASTTEILYRLAPDLGLPITPEIAANLLTGLITDSLGFRTPSVTPDTLRIAAELIERGAELTELYRRTLIQRSFRAIRYWGAGLKTLESDGDLIWASLRLKDRADSGYPGADDADLIDLLTTINEARVVLIFVEQPDRQVKISWRAHSGIDVSQLATKFGGGGHRLAAGATVSGGLEEIRDQVIAETRSAMLEGAA